MVSSRAEPAIQAIRSLPRITRSASSRTAMTIHAIAITREPVAAWVTVAALAPSLPDAISASPTSTARTPA